MNKWEVWKTGDGCNYEVSSLGSIQNINEFEHRAVGHQDTPVGTSIFMVNATDPDQGTGGSVLFSFQPPSPFFSIDGARGIVTVSRRLDYEITSAYQLTVNATDQDKLRPLSSLANLAITLSDIQDMDPIFTNLPYSTNVEEEAPLVSAHAYVLLPKHPGGKWPSLLRLSL
ncbi:cadherin-23 isoform X1 [Tachysurus ichikawai]